MWLVAWFVGMGLVGCGGEEAGGAAAIAVPVPEAPVSAGAAPSSPEAPASAEDIDYGGLLGEEPGTAITGIGMRGEGPQNGGPTYGPHLGEVPKGGLGYGSGKRKAEAEAEKAPPPAPATAPAQAPPAE